MIQYPLWSSFMNPDIIISGKIPLMALMFDFRPLRPDKRWSLLVRDFAAFLQNTRQ